MYVGQSETFRLTVGPSTIWINEIVAFVCCVFPLFSIVLLPKAICIYLYISFYCFRIGLTV